MGRGWDDRIFNHHGDIKATEKARSNTARVGTRRLVESFAHKKVAILSLGRNEKSDIYPLQGY